jgi:hypothetical protein
MSNSKAPKLTWRDVLPVHPAAEMFPLMSPDELKALGEDITAHGLRHRVVLVDHTPKRADGSVHLADTREIVLDGRNRLDAMERLGWSLFDKRGRLKREYADSVDDTETDPDAEFDPYAYVLSANVHRRHLTIKQKRELIAKVLKAQPEKSNRQIAKATGTSHPLVATVREELETAGDVETVTTSVDTKGRQQPAHKSATRSTVALTKHLSTVDNCARNVRAVVCEVMDTIAKSEWAALFAALHEELNQLETASREDA